MAAEVLPIQISATDATAQAFATLKARLKETQADVTKLRQQLGGGAGFQEIIVPADKAGRMIARTRAEMVNFGRQVQDVGVSLASGQSPFMVLIQQGTQIYDVMSTAEGGVKGFTSRLTAAITPARVLAVAGVAAAVAGYALYESWKRFAYQIDDLSRLAAVTSREMTKLQAAASFKGVSQEEFAGGIKRFNEQLYQAQYGAGNLAEIFRANGGIIPKDFNSAMERFADLVKNAASEQQKYVLLAQAGLPATAEMVRFWGQGAEAIRKAKAGLVDLADGNDELVRKAREFDEAWNKAWANMVLYAKNGTVASAGFIAQMFNNLSEFHKLMLLGLGRLAGGLPGGSANLLDPGGASAGAGGSSKTSAAGNAGLPTPRTFTIDPEAVKRALGLEQQRIGILGELALVSDRVRQKEIEIQLARLSGVKITSDEERALKNLAAAQTLSQRNQEAATLGIYVAANAQRQFNSELQGAIDKKLLDPKNAEQMTGAMNALGKKLEQLRDQAAIAAAPLEQLKRLQLEAANLRTGFDQFATSGLNSMTDSLADFAIGAKSASQAFSSFANSVIRDLARLLIRQSITGPLAGLISSAFGGMFGFGGGASSGGLAAGIFGGGGVNAGFGGGLSSFYHTGGIIGAGAMPMRFVHPAYFDNAPRFHSGGMIGTDEVPIIARKGEGVFTPEQMRAMGGGRNVAVDVRVSVDDDGKLAVIARQAGREAGQNAAEARVSSFSSNELPYRLQRIQANPRRIGG